MEDFTTIKKKYLFRIEVRINNLSLSFPLIPLYREGGDIGLFITVFPKVL